METVALLVVLVAKLVVDYSQSRKAMEKVDDLGKLLGGRLDYHEARIKLLESK